MAIHTGELLLLPHEAGRIVSAVEGAEERSCVEFHVCVEATSRYPEARAYALLRGATPRADRQHRMLLYLLAQDRRCYIATDPALRPLESTRAWRDSETRLMLDVLHGRLGEALASAIDRFSHIVAGHYPSASSHRAP